MTEPIAPPRQIAYAVPDLSESTLSSWRNRLGVGPFVTIHHVELSRCDSILGDESFDHSSAYGQLGDLMVELIVEHGERRIGPAAGVHHIAHIVPRLDSAVGHCESTGWPVVLDAMTVGGQRFVMCDARTDLGHLVELYEPDPRLIAFYAHVRDLSEPPTC